MTSLPRICIVIPVYNHGQTVQRVVRAAKQILPVTVVNDGSTDQTAAILAAESGITVVTLPRNQGKGAALRAGFANAAELGFTHAITLDADGQHSTDALPEFIGVCGRQPEAVIVGVRDFKLAGAPWVRRVMNGLSNFWFRFETGVGLTDTQCGYRCYPLSALRWLRLSTGRYAFELEILVKAVWAGLPLVALPVQADYAAPTSRLSHFDPIRDMIEMSWLHSRLSMQAFCIPAPLRKLSAQGLLRGMSRRRRLGTVVKHLLSEHTETAARLATAVGLGLFCGIVPI
jgi:glycosyltransferase involved in cell wall biosynthesis